MSRPHPRRSGGFRIAAAMCGATLAVLLATAALCPAAEAEVWTASAGAKIFPSTKPGAVQSISVSAAGGEYEGVQIGLRSIFRRAVMAEWLPGSDPLLVNGSELDQVMFVHITKPTSLLNAKAGYYPDPLVPRGFGNWFWMGSGSSPYTPGSSKSASLYVLFHVPYGTPAGTYSGTLRVHNGDEVIDLPASLLVYDFGWTQLSTPTAFVLSVPALGKSVAGSGIKFAKQNRQRIVQAAFAMLRKHGLTPLLADALPKVKADGSIDAAAYKTAIDPYLGATGLNLPLTQLPWCNWFPSQPWRRTPYDPRMINYLTQMCQFYKDNGWQDRFYGFYMDEPLGTAEERFVQAMARTLHKASAKAGFRAPFLVTDDPRPKRIHPTLPANKFMWNDIDIWAVRYYYFFGRVPVLRKLQTQGRQVWWYTYANSKVREMPNFVIEKSTADQRVWGWLMYRWNVNGLLYWGVNRWGEPKTGKNWRNPYTQPLSYITRGGQLCNGEASLIYPGYYPKYGLNDPYAAPVSSLRLEALRDGLEDLEYMKIARSRAIASGIPGARAAISAIVSKLTWYKYPLRVGNIFTYPSYVKTPASYMAARDQIAQLIDQLPAQ